MNSPNTTHFRDCYAAWSEEGITLGNSGIEITISIKGNLPITRVIYDKITDYRWSASDGRAVILPTLTVDPKTAKSEITAETDDFEGRMTEHLRVCWTLTDGDSVWQTVWQIFPGLPIIRKSLWAKGAYRAVEPIGQRDVGMWSAHEQASEAIAYDRQSLTIDAVSLHDYNDRHDDLTRNVRYYPYFGSFGQEYQGNLFFLQLSRTRCLSLCKLAPCTESQLYAPSFALRITHQGAAELAGLGIDHNHPLPEGELVELYGCSIGVGRTKADCERDLRALNRACVKLPGKLLVTSNNWGAGNQFNGLDEDFIRGEITLGGAMGLDNVQIDDGWQNNDYPDEEYMKHRWDHMFEEGLDFWAPHKTRFPHGIEPLAQYAKECGTTLGLWIMDDPYEDHRDTDKTVAMILSYYQQGVTVFKLDGVQVNSILDGCRLRAQFDRVHRETDGKLVLYSDITADRRPGCLFMPQAGPCFLENRSLQKRIAGYPHRTVGNLWRMGHYIPTQRLIMELQNTNFVCEGYPQDHLHPSRFPMTTVFLGVAVANPLFWTELRQIPDHDRAALTELIARWKTYAEDLFRSDICPIGSDPEDFCVSGFHAKGNDEGHLFLINYDGMTADIAVDIPDGTKLEPMWADTAFTAEIQNGMLHFEAETSCRGVWVKY
ncbi:MAG: hypothetical protein IKZ09_07380, partial [Clostridia bacterium]|nr:hypothetical protein [Clostridia bacterium]